MMNYGQALDRSSAVTWHIYHDDPLTDGAAGE
jgi:hypothetical protein